jgi:hypothetical protein
MSCRKRRCLSSELNRFIRFSQRAERYNPQRQRTLYQRSKEAGMPITVHYWSAHSRLPGIGAPGHVSVEYVSTRLKKMKGYISWWPGISGVDGYVEGKKIGNDGRAKKTTRSDNFAVRTAEPHLTFEEDLFAEMGDRTRQRLDAGTFKPRDGQRQYEYTNEQNQKQMMWVQYPHQSIVIDCADEAVLDQNKAPIQGATSVGLNLKRIHEWWGCYCPAPNRYYRMASTKMNCASVALVALNVGGAHLFTDKPLTIRTFATPAEIYQYAKKVAAGVAKYNATLSSVHAVSSHYGGSLSGTRPVVEPTSVQKLRSHALMRDLATIPQRNAGPELWSVQEWTKQSYVAAGLSTGLARRKDQVARIDALLAKYHELTWDVSMPQRCAERYGLVRKMLEQAHDHMRQKADSQRSQAMLNFARQLVAVAAYRSVYCDIFGDQYPDLQKFLLT